MFWALEELEDAGELDAREATLARVAAWLHDAVYDPKAVSGANESESALLARGVLGELDLDDDDVDTVEELVLMTAGHESTAGPPRPIESAFHDADLWILSAPDSRFDDYCRQVRSEYAHAVSYTHLLAEKERLYFVEHRIGHTVAKSNGVTYEALVPAEHEAVSYTHLDVYKRQGLGRRGPDGAPAGSFAGR